MRVEWNEFDNKIEFETPPESASVARSRERGVSSRRSGSTKCKKCVTVCLTSILFRPYTSL